MKSFVRIVKRKSPDNPPVATMSSARKTPQRTAEMIVKSWIKESRERRWAEVKQLQNAVFGKTIGELARG